MAICHSARVVEVLSPVTGGLINSLADMGIVSFEEIREQLVKLKSEDPEKRGQRKKRALVKHLLESFF